MKFLIFIIICSVIFFGAVFFAEETAAINGADSEAEGIVPCGSPGQDPCTLCDFYSLIQRVINFILLKILFPVAALMMLVGGFILLTSRGNEKALSTGKATLTYAVIGIMIAYGAWLIVNTLLTVINFHLPFSNAPLTPWNALPMNCARPAPPSPPPPAEEPPPTQPPPDTFLGDAGDNQNFAAVIEKNPRIKFQDTRTYDEETLRRIGSCGAGIDSALNFREIRNGQTLTICDNACRCFPRGFNANPMILGSISLLGINQNLSFTVTSISTGQHSPDSEHYQGNAVDLVPDSRTQAGYQELRNQFRNSAGYTRRIDCAQHRARVSGCMRIDCENSSGGVVSDCGGATSHVHATFIR